MSSSLGGTSGFSRTGGSGVRSGWRRRSAQNCRHERAAYPSPSHISTTPKENKSVRASNSLRPRLLRRHVSDGAERAPGTGEVLLGHRVSRAVVAAQSSTLRSAGVTFARPKSRILAWPRSVTKMLAGLMSRCTIPSACAASSASAISIPSPVNLDLDRPSGDAMLQGHAIQKFHGDERADRRPRRCRKWCRCWDGSGRKQPEPRAGSGLEPADREQLHRAGISGRRNGAAGCPLPCRRHPSRRHRASR